LTGQGPGDKEKFKNSSDVFIVGAASCRDKYGCRIKSGMTASEQLAADLVILQLEAAPVS
jgi:hypothetical protein